MRLLHIAAAGVLIASISAAVAEDATVSIESILANGRIVGKVQGDFDYSRHKVIVYVKTDRWYVHPYASGGEGKSWARIQPDGTWVLPTVRRQFPASVIAAIVTDIRYREPTVAEDVAAIPHRAIVKRSLSGTPDEGKL